MNENEQDKLDRLQKELYNRDFKSPLPPTRQEFSEKDIDVEKVWHHDEPQQESPSHHGPRMVTGSFFRKILISAFVFFIISAGLLLYIFLGGWNIISASNVDISFLGPVTVVAGNELDFDVVINNQNRSAIENATLYLDFPDGTKQVTDITKDLLHDTQAVGEVPAKQTSRRTIRAVLFGELNSQQDIKITLTYGLKNANASYRKEKSYDVTISSTPVTITVTHPNQVISGDNVELVASIASNSSAPLSNILLRLDTPFGFAFSSADPKPSFGSNLWLIPLLNPGQKKDFAIHGVLEGEQGDERVFHFVIGTQSLDDEKTIAVRYFNQAESVFVQKSPLALTMSLNDKTDSPYLTDQGANIQGNITVTNNLPVRVTNARVEVVFAGPLFNPNQVQALGGLYEVSTHSILWDKSRNPALVSLDPGDSTTLNFNIITAQPSTSIRNATMTIKTTVSALQANQSDSSNQISFSQIRTIQAGTTISVVPQIVYSTGPFRNKGPIPPKVDTPTTYTVILTATNSTNNVEQAEVHATLPTNVHWQNSTNPASESITWNSDKNEVVWHVGNLDAGTGFSKPARTVAFQVSLSPTLADVGSPAEVVTNITMNAVDAFTTAPLTASANTLTTRLSTDPAYNGQEANVTK